MTVGFSTLTGSPARHMSCAMRILLAGLVLVLTACALPTADQDEIDVLFGEPLPVSTGPSPGCAYPNAVACDPSAAAGCAALGMGCAEVGDATVVCCGSLD